MLRTTLAALAITAVLTSVSFGDCASCGGGIGYAGRGVAANAWEGYCGCEGGNACGNVCGGCNRCCFPLVHGTLNRVGRVFDALLPDPCCRRACGPVGCAQPSCGIEPGCGIVGPGDPFIDDHRALPVPTPAADPHARARSGNSARMMTYPKPALKPVPMKTGATKSRSKVAKNGKAAGKSVLKVAYEEQWLPADETEDAPPAAPASIRNAAQEPADMAPVARFAAKPVVGAKAETSANPLRP